MNYNWSKEEINMTRLRWQIQDQQKRDEEEAGKTLNNFVMLTALSAFLIYAIMGA